MKFIIGILISISILIAGSTDKIFNIDSVSIKIYDHNSNKIVLKPTSIYGNNMSLFVAIKISQINDYMQKYTLSLKGHGKGRENDAEGLVEDYNVSESKNVVLYTNEPQFIPFILEYPCTEEGTFTIILSNEKGTRVTKKVINNLTGCSLN
ncbi:hypothetical protein [Sulfurimonas sp.]|uniref:hypothetical protein n=1 Tax=Sulfurimonas sp. TaxID=2022749 RepID=UPI002B46D541|nr:hypothetical protein [Sulfurimonas sp.]